MSARLVLSLFPGIGLLDKAFEEAGFCIVRGPDLLWGGDVRRFHPPANVFVGVIGGPPCQAFSRLRHIVLRRHGAGSLAPNLIPEFERCIAESRPNWWLMENVEDAPQPTVNGYLVVSAVLNNRWLGAVQNRRRKFCFGSREGLDPFPHIQLAPLEAFDYEPTVCASGGGRSTPVAIGGSGKLKRRIRAGDCNSRRLVAKSCELQGLPPDFLDHAPFTVQGKQRVIGNGVPLPMGRAIADAIWMVTNAQ